jgi:hypothetical protein
MNAHGSAAKHRRWRSAGWMVLIAVIGFLTWSSCASSSHAAVGLQMQISYGCPGSAVSTVGDGQKAVDVVAIDGSRSTRSAELRQAYERVALKEVGEAARLGAAVRVVEFGASGVGARVVLSGSFAPVSTVEAFNLAAGNRLRCLAAKALSTVLSTHAHEGTGTDVAGAVASQIAAARTIAVRGGSISVTVVSDGCQAPAATGPNRHLTDLCGLLGRGEGVERVLATHSAEFQLGDARGVSLRMEGLGVGRFADRASTARAQVLVRFWQTVCARAHAAACEIGSDLS